MASETDIKRMLIDALRPSLFEVVKQELTPLAEVRAEIAKSEAALQQRIDELSDKVSGTIADRIDLASRDLQRHFDQEIEVRLASLKAQLVVLNQAAIDALSDELRRAQAGAAARADRFDRRLGAAAAALRDGAAEPAEAAPEQHHSPAGE